MYAGTCTPSCENIKLLRKEIKRGIFPMLTDTFWGSLMWYNPPRYIVKRYDKNLLSDVELDMQLAFHHTSYKRFITFSGNVSVHEQLSVNNQFLAEIAKIKKVQTTRLFCKHAELALQDSLQVIEETQKCYQVHSYSASFLEHIPLEVCALIRLFIGFITPSARIMKSRIEQIKGEEFTLTTTDTLWGTLFGWVLPRYMSFYCVHKRLSNQTLDLKIAFHQFIAGKPWKPAQSEREIRLSKQEQTNRFLRAYRISKEQD